MRSQKNPLGRKEDIVVQEMDGEVLIYDLKNNKAFCLNDTSAMVWQMCDGEKSVEEIRRELSKKLSRPVNEDLVWLALDQLKRENLIESEIPMPSAYEGMNRREVIKKVGLGSMIALPIISGMVAPKAVNAASTCTANPNDTNLCSCATGSVNQAGQPCVTGGGLGNMCPAGCTPRFADNFSANCVCR